MASTTLMVQGRFWCLCMALGRHIDLDQRTPKRFLVVVGTSCHQCTPQACNFHRGMGRRRELGSQRGRHRARERRWHCPCKMEARSILEGVGRFWGLCMASRHTMVEESQGPWVACECCHMCRCSSGTCYRWYRWGTGLLGLSSLVAP
ncbi:hypothetical protein BGX38DRAFT_1152757 [Terfezia claveryi]|nr:hypothetical protein BGX38DRAFT_1152757 [Terfezia claveryi]